MTVPTKNPATDVAVTDHNTIATPAMTRPLPASAKRRGSVRWKSRSVSAPLAASANSAAPPRTVEPDPATWAASEGPSEP